MLGHDVAYNGEETVMGATSCHCPKCRSTELTATETTEAAMDFAISGGVITRLSHTDEFGEIIGLRITCNKCGHRWKPRKARQITDLVRADGTAS